MRRVALLILILCSIGDLYAQSKQDKYNALRSEIDKQIDQYFVGNAEWGILIQSINNGDVVYAHNAQKNMIPASNMKLFSSIFALDKLGPDFKYTTSVYLRGSYEDDTTFAGDLIIRGMGDPTISGRFQDNNVTRILEDWADSLLARHIKRIKGRIIGDDNFFGDDALGRHWEWNEESYWYSAQVSGLSLNDNCVNWYITPTHVGEKARILLDPPTQYLQVDNQTMTVATPGEASTVDVIRGRATNHVTAVGKIPVLADTRVGYVTVENPTWYTATVLKETLEFKRIRVDSSAVDIDSLSYVDSSAYRYDPSDSMVIRVATYTSPPLSEILKIINKRSQNFFAEQLFRTVAAVLDSNGTGDHALEMLKTFVTEIGLKPEKMAFNDGSGYARTNLVTAESLVGILKFIRGHKYWPVFYQSLPLAGKEKTLHYRMIGTAAEGNVRAKTGTIDNVKTISGFVKTADGEEWVFSILCNNFTVNPLEIERIQDSILVKLAEFRRIP